MRQHSLQDIPVMPLPEWVAFKDLESQLSAAILVHDFLGAIPEFVVFEILQTSEMGVRSLSLSDEPDHILILCQSRRSRQLASAVMNQMHRRNPKHVKIQETLCWDHPRNATLHGLLSDMAAHHVTLHRIHLPGQPHDNSLDIHILRTPFVIAEFKRQLDMARLLHRDPRSERAIA